ncbi:TPA: hypothetical protein N0F65_002744, partial [Lagenidium giganteum]
LVLSYGAWRLLLASPAPYRLEQEPSLTNDGQSQSRKVPLHRPASTLWLLGNTLDVTKYHKERYHDWLKEDLKKMFSSLASDIFAEIGFGIDLGSLTAFGTPGSPHPFLAAHIEVGKMLQARSQQPYWLWKLKRRLGVGIEKIGRQSLNVMHGMMNDVILKSMAKEHGPDRKDFLSVFLTQEQKMHQKLDTAVVRDMMLNMYVAGQNPPAGAMGWFIVMMNRHPAAAAKIPPYRIEQEPSSSTKDEQTHARKVPLHRPASTLWLLGNTLDVTKHHKERFHDWLTEESERAGWKPWLLSMVGDKPAIVLSTPEAFDDVLQKQPDIFEKGEVKRELMRDLLGDGIVAADGELWRLQRRRTSHLFLSPTVLPFMAEVVTRQTRKLCAVVDALMAEQRSFSLKKLLNSLTSDIFGEVGFGIDLGDLVAFGTPGTTHPFLCAVNEASKLLQARVQQPQWLWKLKRKLGVGMEKTGRQHLNVIYSIVHDVILKSMERDQASDRKDFLSVFLAQEQEKRKKLDTVVVRDMALNMFVAGQTTTTEAMAWFIVMMNCHPDVAAKIRDEIADKLPSLAEANLAGVAASDVPVPTLEDVQSLTYLEACLRESMRLNGPALNSRKAMKDTMLSDGTFRDALLLPAGLLVLSYGAWRVLFASPAPYRIEQEPSSTNDGQSHARKVPLHRPASTLWLLGNTLDVTKYHKDRYHDWLKEDLKHLFCSLTTDIFGEIGFGVDLGSLAAFGSPGATHPFLSAHVEVGKMLQARTQQPYWLWKLKRRLGVGVEKTGRRSLNVMHGIVNDVILKGMARVHGPERKDFLSVFLAQEQEKQQKLDTTVVRDMMLSIYIAGQNPPASAMGWFIVMMNRHPDVAAKIRDEIADKLPSLAQANLAGAAASDVPVPTLEDVQSLTYLEACLRESMRLNGPALNTREAKKDTVLSDGTQGRPSSPGCSSCSGRLTCIYEFF